MKVVVVSLADCLLREQERVHGFFALDETTMNGDARECAGRVA